MLKFLAICFVALFQLSALFCISLATMIYGWGLHPVSYPWIVGGLAAMFAVTLVGGVITKAVQGES